MYERGESFDTIPGRTWAEVNTLQLGWIVDQERTMDAENAAYSGHTTATEQNKREHKQSIQRRLVAQ